MSSNLDFGETSNVAVTVLVDNRADLLVRSTETVKRFTEEPLLAEHGLAMLIHLQDAGRRILWDAGCTRTALLENLRLLKIDPATIDIIALSHGHGDHTAAMTDVIQAVVGEPGYRRWDKEAPLDEILRHAAGRRVPLVAHPAAFRERWSFSDDGTRYGPALPPPRAAWEAAGAELILTESPYRLGPGCWTTGYVPRRSFEQAGRSASRFYRVEDQFLRDDLEDDQAIVLNVKDKGLIVVSGCAHAGIVNTIQRAREISGVDRVWAVLGGFHLAPANEQEIQRTIDEVKQLAPAMVAPSHCTGFPALCQFASQMADVFVLNVVGTRYLF